MCLITIPFHHQTFVGNVEEKINYMLAMILAYFVLLYATFLKIYIKRNTNTYVLH